MMMREMKDTEDRIIETVRREMAEQKTLGISSIYSSPDHPKKQKMVTSSEEEEKEVVIPEAKKKKISTPEVEVDPYLEDEGISKF